MGKTHDFSIFKQEFPKDIQWFKNQTIRVDLGFQGIDKLYEISNLGIPIKKKRVKKGESNELSKEDKEYNKQISKERIYVENAIAGLKRYKILVHKSMLKSKGTRDNIVGLCAALWNFFIS